jgi:hypothetical protein
VVLQTGVSEEALFCDKERGFTRRKIDLNNKEQFKSDN